MKNYRLTTFIAAGLLAFSCQQDIPTLTPPPDPTVPSGTAGTLNLSKFVTIGNSLAAGYQAGALFTEGQNNSLGKILNQQFTYAGGTSSFNQPDINSLNGYSSAPGGGLVLGRYILFDPDGDGPRSAGPTPAGTPARSVTCPSTVSTPAVPAPYNGGDLPTPFTGDKTKLNNFGVPGILLGQALTPLTGGPSTGNPAFNGLYARFASNPGVSTILGDAIAAQPTFFLVELGNNDVLGYATTGASGDIALTSEAAFTGQYTSLITNLLAGAPNAKGVVANIPDVTSIPFFFSVTYNAVPMDAATAAQVNAGFAGYNQILSAVKANAGLLSLFGLNADDLESRKVSFSESKNNRILIVDKYLKDLGPVFDFLASPAGGSMISPTQRAQLSAYQLVRQATATDLFTLPAGGVIGTCVGGNPQIINGISYPLQDQYVLLPKETELIKTRTAAFNKIISDLVAANSTRLALADVNAAFNSFVATKGTSQNGILLLPTIAPPYAAFSEDGVHPNGRGYAYLANIFIDAINAKFGATIPKADVTQYNGTRTPVTPTSTY